MQTRNKAPLRPSTWFARAALPALLAILPALSACAEPATVIPPPAFDEAPGASGPQSIVLAGGCFWGVQGVFQHLRGVTQAVSGYAGGTRETAEYETVSTGRTGHAESVRVTFDPKVVTLGRILQVYFSVAHDPTQLNRQGPDSGTQYRSAIFVADPKQREIAERYIAQLDQAHVFSRPIVTRVDPLTGFYPAEAYHQDYATLHPHQPYIAYNDLPKIENLQRIFPDSYQSAPVLVGSAQAGR